MFNKLIVFIFILVISNISYCFAIERPEFKGKTLIVTATKFPQDDVETSSTVTVITRKEIEASTAKNVADIIRNVAGVDVKANGGLGAISSVQLRGGNANQTLILLDGVRINSPSLGSADLGDILLSDVERIEIVKDPISSVYGADAIGGVINIITNDSPIKPKTNADILYGLYGTFSTQKYKLSNNGRIGPLKYFISATELKSDGFRQNSAYNAQNYYVKFGSDNIMLKLLKYVDEKGVPGVPASDTDKYSASLPNDSQADDNTYLNLSLQGNISDKAKIKSNIYLNEIQMKNHYMDWFVPNLFYDDLYKSYIRGIEANTELNFSKYFTTILGGEWRENESSGPLTETHMVHDYALYAQGNIKVNKNSNIDFSVRADKNTSFAAQISPKVGTVIHIFPDTDFRATLSNSFRAPTMNELYWNQPSYGTFGNPNLRPEKAAGLSVGLEKQIGIESSAVLSWYKNEVRDLIKWNQTGPFSWQPVNIDKTFIEGVDFEIRKKFGQLFCGYINYSYQKVTNPATGKTLIYCPENKYNLGVDYLNPTGINSNVTLNHVGSRFTDAADTKTLSPYTLINLKISKKILNYNIYINCENLFNEDYAESVGTAANDFAERPYPMPGRRYEIGLTLL